MERQTRKKVVTPITATLRSSARVTSASNMPIKTRINIYQRDIWLDSISEQEEYSTDDPTKLSVPEIAIFQQCDMAMTSTESPVLRDITSVTAETISSNSFSGWISVPTAFVNNGI